MVAKAGAKRTRVGALAGIVYRLEVVHRLTSHAGNYNILFPTRIRAPICYAAYRR